MKSDPPKLCYSVKEACTVTPWGRSTLYQLMASGRLRSVRVGGRRLIPADALRALVEGEE